MLDAPEVGVESEFTGQRPENIAAVALRFGSDGIPNHVDAGTPTAAHFAEQLGILHPDVQDFAGSAARGEWVDKLSKIEAVKLGPIKTWLTRIIGGDTHPILRQSIDWITQHGDTSCVPLKMLLADLYMAVGETERAKETYSAALRMHREMTPEMPIME